MIVLTSDNGADIDNTGCNYPYRGTKGTMFEGNVRTLTVLSGGVIPTLEHGKSRKRLFSSLDWTPTLLSFAGIYDKIPQKYHTWDGFNQRNMILQGDEYAQRDEIVLNIGNWLFFFIFF